MRARNISCALAAVLALFVCAPAAAADDDQQAAAEELPSNCQKTVFEGEEADYYYGHVCFYPGQTIARVYADYKSGVIGGVDAALRDDWKETLETGRDSEYEVHDNIGITYRWTGKSEVTVETYQISSIAYTFTQKEDGVEVTYLFSRD